MTRKCSLWNPGAIFGAAGPAADGAEIALTYGHDLGRAVAILSKLCCRAEDVGKRQLGKQPATGE